MYTATDISMYVKVPDRQQAELHLVSTSDGHSITRSNANEHVNVSHQMNSYHNRFER